MPEMGDHDALKRFVKAHVDHTRAKAEMEAARKRMAREQIAAMRYLQTHGSTSVVMEDGSLLARLKITEPGIELL